MADDKSIASVTDSRVSADGRRATNDTPQGGIFDYAGPAMPNPFNSDAAVPGARVIERTDFAKNGGEF